MKVALVTGAASGIGLAIAQTLQNTMKVVFADINETELQKVTNHSNASYVVANLVKQEDCKNLVAKVVEKHGKIDVLVNVAGIQHVAPVDQFPEEKWDFMIALMLTAPFLLTKYSLPYMKENNYGRIININSIHGLVASEFKAAYVSAKHGLSGLTKVVALEGGKFGITCNSICPAYVRTPLVDKQIENQAQHHNISTQEVIEQIMLKQASVKRLIEAHEIAAMVEFLCSENAKSISGSCINIDGGWTAN